MMSSEHEATVHPLRLIRVQNIKRKIAATQITPEVSKGNKVETASSTDSNPCVAKREDRSQSNDDVTAEHFEECRKYQCHLCKEWLSSIQDYIEHSKNHEISPKCPYCYDVFHETEFHRHIKTHGTAGHYVCPLCQSPHVTPTGLLAHMAYHDSVTGWHKCPACPKQLTSIKALSNHMEIHNEKKSSKCSVCSKSFVDEKRLQRHQRETHKLNTVVFTCPECGKSLKSRNSIRYHMMTHSGNTPYNCDVCGESHPTPPSLWRHKQTHNASLHQCAICLKEFKSKKYLQLHVLRHDDSSPYKCTRCNSQFTSKPNLKKHILIHTGEAKTVCPICKKIVANERYLKIHIQFHDNQRNYACPKCDKRFNSKHHLTIHSKVHIDEKPFKCSWCDHACRYSGNLIKHVRRCRKKKVQETGTLPV